jgi:hypothetical protein
VGCLAHAFGWNSSLAHINLSQMTAAGRLAAYLLVRHLPGCRCHAASSAIPIRMEAAIFTLSQDCHGSKWPPSAPLLFDKIIFEERRCQRDKPSFEVNSEIYHIKSW